MATQPEAREGATVSSSPGVRTAATIAVAGDRMVDWGLVGSDAAGADLDVEWVWQAGATFQLVPQSLGADVTGGLLDAVLREEGRDDVAVRVEPLPAAALTDPRHPAVVRAFSIWSPQPGRGREGQGRAWRVQRILGRAQPTATLEADDDAGSAPDLVALLDLALGFRADPARWRRLLAGAPQVFVRTTVPLGEGELWAALREHADRLTVVVDVADLRRAALRVEQPLSWERLYDHVVSAVAGSPLSVARRVVVTLDLAGAVVIEHGAPCPLVFDPHLQANESHRLGAGFVVGQQQVMLAALVRGSLLGAALTASARRGLEAMRDLHAYGFEVSGEAGHEAVAFPYARIARALREGRDEVACTDLSPERLVDSSIVVESLKGDELGHAARRAAREGADGLRGVPVETIGAWSSVDRVEIENLRSLRAVMADYVESYRTGRRIKRPLSVAVFGPPGAGKSFAVKQVAASLLPGRLRVLEFNLSQMSDDEGLAGAFHAVRDAVLEQRLPLVFWDEFDTPLAGTPLGWLRHFLMPMQDAAFVDGEVSHPLGPAIFVFAGGTCATFAEFSTDDTPDDRRAKKSDFISRLRGYMDVLGPNPAGADDVGVGLRRALLLRSILQQSAPQLFRDGRLAIDEGVLTAFLGVPAFRHGARSIEAIVDMSALGGKATYERASLPAPRQLALHVDADVFLELVAAG